LIARIQLFCTNTCAGQSVERELREGLSGRAGPALCGPGSRGPQRARCRDDIISGGMEKPMISRRTFVNGVAASVAGSAIASGAKSYAQIVGANDRLNFAVNGNGHNGRATAHLGSLADNSKTARIAYICDVDSDLLGKFSARAQAALGYSPKAIGDFREALNDKEVDAITVATPDHWHTPMAVYALKAGKHVYVEKPSSQNAREGELLVAAQKKYGKLVQVGDQEDSRRVYRRGVYGQELVREHAWRHALRRAGRRARHAQLGSVAGAGTAERV
jgi:hypothetical protein